MIKTLSFSTTTNPIKPPAITSGAGAGLTVSLWVRRSGSGSRQRLVDFADNDKNKLILETGDQPDSLSIGTLQGTARQEVIAAGVLPQNRWVQVTASFGAFGVTLEVFGVVVARALIPPVTSGPLQNWYIAGGGPDNRFVGELSMLTVLIYPSALSQSTVWAIYPLSGAVFDHVDQTSSGPQDYYRVKDISGNKRHARNYGGLPIVQYPEPLLSDQTPVLQLDRTSSGVKLSPLPAGTRDLTLEAWIRLDDVKSQQPIITFGSDGGQLVLSAGGAQSQLELIGTAQGSVSRSYLTAINVLSPGVYTHVAATLDFTDSKLIVTLYLQGRQVAVSSQSSSAGGGRNGFAALFNAMAALVQFQKLVSDQAVQTVLTLGGSIGTAPGFGGQLAEVRVWASALSASDIASRVYSRAVGNEANLIACYRLEHSANGLVYDLSPSRGLGSLPSGASIVPTASLPLLYTTDPDGIYLKTRGKLIKESVIFAPTVVKRPGFRDINIPAKTVSRTVFDATIEPQSPDGNRLGGRSVQVWPDAQVAALIPSGDYVVPELWTAGQIQTVTVPASGTLRLRFWAEDLFCPILRVRIDGMPDGVWATIRPDIESLAKLASVTQGDLTQPAGGRPSPLPANLSSSDAAAVAQTLAIIGSGFAPRPQPKLGSAQSRSFLSDLGNTIGDGLTTAGDALSSGTSTVVNGLKQVGSVGGSLSSALIDDGSVALGSIAGTAKSAGSLIASDASQLTDLIKAGAMAAARTGTGAISDAIKSADTLATVSEAVAGEVSRTIAIVGTTIVNGATVVWRVICTTASDLLQAAKSFFDRIGATISQFLEYLAWLFNWGDFLAAADRISGYVTTQLGSLPSLLTGLASFKSQLNQYLTLPSSVGSKSLADLCGVSIPNNINFEELSYVLEIANKVISSSRASFSGADQLTASLQAAAGGLNSASLQTLAASLGTGQASGLQSPLDLLSTPVQTLFNNLLTGSPTTSIVDFLFTLIGDALNTMLSAASGFLTARINIPDLTSWVESTILGGRTLNLLNLAALAAGIAQVLTVKIGASAQSGSMSPQPTSFAADGSVAIESWVNFALGIIIVLVEGARVGIELSAGKAPASGGEASIAEVLANVPWDAALGVLCLVRGSIKYAINASMPSAAKAALDALNSFEFLAGAWQVVLAGLRTYFAVTPAYGAKSLKVATIADLGISSLLFVGSLISAITAASTPGAFTSQSDWAGFGLSVGGYLSVQTTLVLTAAADLDAKNSVPPVAQVGLAALTLACDLGSAIADAVGNPA